MEVPHQKPPKLTMIERFWQKVDKTPGQGPEGDCWIWTACNNGVGYGWFNFYGKGWLSHRIAYTLLVGPIPAGFHLLHKCDTRRCVNPAHLRPGTDKDNNNDMMSRRRHHAHSQTHCKHGHEYTPVNIILHSCSGARMCRTCKALRNIARREANRARPDYASNKARAIKYKPETLTVLQTYHATHCN